jgi:3'(2'), 5'-bisphosphate nucleotidase
MAEGSMEQSVSIMDATASAELLQPLTTLAARVALAIREKSGKEGIRCKEDGSPVTAADLAAEAMIRDGLSALAPALPIVSEEQAEYPSPGTQGSYFLVDPLDGTREFIAGRDEYAINIALVSNRAPLLGVIAAPALGLIWRGIVGRGAERLAFAADGGILPPSPIQTRHRPQREPVVVVSRSHLDAHTQAYLDRLPQPRTLLCGSAVKFCRVAEGSADLYPRLSPTHDWDVGAGHAIVLAAGGGVLAPDGGALRYGSAELIIPGFIAAGETAKT